MKLEIPKCPECGELAHGVLESLAGMAMLNVSENGDAEYDGETDVWWDEQRTVYDADGRATLWCRNRHEWQSRIMETDGKANPTPSSHAA